MLIDKYNRLLLDKLPKNLRAEVQYIAQQTNNFEDDEACEIFSPNMTLLMEIIAEKHPEALKEKRKLLQKQEVKKVLLKKDEPKSEEK